MSAEFKVWMSIEEIDEDNDVFGGVGEPEELGCFDSEAKARDYMDEVFSLETANTNLSTTVADLLDALNYLLEQTVDADLKHGIALTEGEADAREKALAAIAKAKGEA